MNKGVAPFQIYAEPLGAPNGAQKSFPLLFCGKPATRVGSLRAVYRQDWQGRQALSPLPRTNLAFPSSPASIPTWGVNKSTSGTVTTGLSDAAGGYTATRYQVTTATTNFGPWWNKADVLIPGRSYAGHVWLRGLTGAEYVRVFAENSDTPAKYILLSSKYQRIDFRFTKTVSGGAVTFYLCGGPDQNTAAPVGAGVDVFGMNVYDAADGNGATIITTTAPVTVTDYTFDAANVLMSAAPPTGSSLYWDGDVLIDIRIRELTDLSRAINDELFGPGDGVSRILPLKIGGSVYAGVSRVDNVYCTDWRGRQRLYPTPRTQLVTRTDNFSAWTNYFVKWPSLRGGDIGPDGLPSASSFLLSESNGGSGANEGGIFCNADAGADLTKTTLYGIWARADAPCSMRIGGLTLGRGGKRCDLTTQWQFFSGSSIASGQTNRRGMCISAYLLDPLNVTAPPGTRVYFAYPQMTQDAVLGAFIPNATNNPVSLIDYTVLGPSIYFGSAPLGSAGLSWDGEIFWQNVPSLLPPNATPTERAAEGATARIADVGAPLRALWNPAACPVELLPWLAWSLSVDTWRPEWPEHIKRARLASAISIQRHKGTVKSVRDVVESFGGAVEIVEWWQKTPKGAPHTFDLTLTLSGNDGNQATAQFVDDVIAEVNKTKPVRSQFNFTQGVALFGSVGVAPYLRPVVMARLEFTGS